MEALDAWPTGFSSCTRTADRVLELYQDGDLQWRWRVIGANGSDIVADSAEGYVHRIDALHMAAELFPGVFLADDPSDPEKGD